MREQKRIIIKQDTLEIETKKLNEIQEEEDDLETTTLIRYRDILKIYTPLLTLFSLVVHHLYLYSESIKLSEHAVLKSFFHFSKKNIMNVVFIKNGFVLVVPLIIINRLASNTRESGFFTRIFKVFFLWYITVVSLIPFSRLQSLTDLLFVYTGGECVLTNQDINSKISKKNLRKVRTLNQCKRLKGRWMNGHDLSGHLFFLSLMVWFIGMEVLELSGNSHNKTLRHGRKLKKVLKLFSFALLFIYGYNIMITVLNEFHCFKEIITGFLWGYFGGYLIYQDHL